MSLSLYPSAQCLEKKNPQEPYAQLRDNISTLFY
jgi:hypothetical protein